MPLYRVEFRRSAEKDLRHLDTQTQTRVLRAIEGLVRQPRPAGCRKLTDRDDAYRIRVGDYRVVYTISDIVLVVAIERIRHRRAKPIGKSEGRLRFRKRPSYLTAISRILSVAVATGMIIYLNPLA